MNEVHLHERLEQVVNLIPRYSWALMDEAQKDDLMLNIVLPRYNAITSDGEKLGPTTWAAILGTTATAISQRVYRLQAKQTPTETSPHAVTTGEEGAMRTVKSAMSRKEGAVEQFVESLPPETKVAVAKALAQTPASAPVSPDRGKKAKAAVAPLKRTMNSVVAQLSTVSLIDQATAEINAAVSNEGLNPDAFRQIEEAVERLIAALDFAKSMAGEAA